MSMTLMNSLYLGCISQSLECAFRQLPSTNCLPPTAFQHLVRGLKNDHVTVVAGAPDQPLYLLKRTAALAWKPTNGAQPAPALFSPATVRSSPAFEFQLLSPSPTSQRMHVSQSAEFEQNAFASFLQINTKSVFLHRPATSSSAWERLSIPQGLWLRQKVWMLDIAAYTTTSQPLRLLTTIFDNRRLQSEATDVQKTFSLGEH